MARVARVEQYHPGLAGPGDAGRSPDTRVPFHEIDQSQGQRISLEVARKPVKKRVKLEDFVKEMHAGKRTKYFLTKYGIPLERFEEILKKLIRDKWVSKEEYIAWKAHRPMTEALKNADPPKPERPVAPPVAPSHKGVETFVIDKPNKRDIWALQLFATKREEMKGSSFKMNLHGRKYSFTVESLVYRGTVDLLEDDEQSQVDRKQKKQEALDYIAKHGWAAYLENRAFVANFGPDEATVVKKKARLVVVHCRGNTYLAALHTPTPSIILYVAPSLPKIVKRLSKHIDESTLDV
ncbi:hypothetical protein ACFL2Q_12250 [Thermodesulfobacteriota bacterium]